MLHDLMRSRLANINDCQPLHLMWTYFGGTQAGDKAIFSMIVTIPHRRSLTFRRCVSAAHAPPPSLHAVERAVVLRGRGLTRPEPCPELPARASATGSSAEDWVVRL